MAEVSPNSNPTGQVPIDRSLMVEEWRESPEYPGYLVSNTGKLKTKRGELSKITPNPEGYYRAGLVNRQGKTVYIGVHTVIGQAFLVKLPHHTVINHINGDPSDNHIVNLEWVSDAENLQRAVNRRARSGRKVVKFDLQGNELTRYPSATQAAREENCFVSNLCKACRDEKPYKGFQWRYLDLIEVHEGEIWAPLYLDDTILSVSSMGRVWTSQGITFGSETGAGYKRVNIKISGKVRGYYVHRLVCQAFLPIANWEEMEVNHRSNDHIDNRIENLEWVTHQQNMDHAVQFRTSEFYRADPVHQIASDGVTIIATFRSATDAARQLDLNQQWITKICDTGRGTSGGYYWRYANK